MLSERTWRSTGVRGLGVLASTYFVDSCYTELVLLAFNCHLDASHHLTMCHAAQQRI